MKYLIGTFLAVLFAFSGNMMYRPSFGIVSMSVLSDSKTNSTTSEQNFTSIYTIPAGYLESGRACKVTLGLETQEGVSTATVYFYVDIGGVRCIQPEARDMPNTDNRTMFVSFIVQGTAAAAASASVLVLYDGNAVLNKNAAQAANEIAQPVTLATNSDLTINAGVKWSATGSTETWTLRSVIVETIN